MTALGEALARQALERIRTLSPSKLIEPRAAYKVTDQGDHIRLLSGSDAMESGMVQVDGSDNVVVTGFDAQVRRHCAFHIKGRGNVIFLGAHSRITSTNIVIEGDNNLIAFGAFTSTGGIAVRLADDGGHIVVGDRCMFSTRITVGDIDPLVIYNRKTRRRVDARRNITIGDHTWIAREVRIEPGASIGAETIVGQGAVVNSGHPDNVILAGAPATVRASDVTWSRKEDASLDAMEASNHYKALYLAPLKTLMANIERHAANGSAEAGAQESPTPVS